MWYKIAGSKIIDQRPWVGKYVPIVRVIGEETIIGRLVSMAFSVGTIWAIGVLGSWLFSVAVGRAAANAKQFELVAKLDDKSFGICSAPFLDHAFKTTEYRIAVTVNPDGTWSYEQDTVLMIRRAAEPFHHTDRNTLTKIAEPTPNPLARKS